MADLSVNIAGVSFANPVITASGCFGYGREYAEMYKLSELGGISIKGTTPEPRLGNPSPRIAETPSGMLNSVGLQNPGVDYVIKNELPWLKEQGTRIIANIAGRSVEDYIEIAHKLNDTCADIIEMNISCPNVKSGGVAFGIIPEMAAQITREVRKVCKKPLMVKLSPNTAFIGDVAAAAEAEGADALSLINTLTGMRIDINTRRPILRNNTGGLSGPAVFPVAVRMVREVYKRVKIPIVGMGGVTTWQDAVEIMMAGAAAVQVGTANFTDPYAPIAIKNGINNFLDDNNITLSEIVGSAEEW